MLPEGKSCAIDGGEDWRERRRVTGSLGQRGRGSKMRLSMEMTYANVISDGCSVRLLRTVLYVKLT